MKTNYYVNEGFIDYFKELRTIQKISDRSLVEGICSPRKYSYWENKTRDLDLCVVERLLSRLGVGAEDFQILLGFREYEKWHDRTKIFYAIKKKELQEAKKLLETYVINYAARNNVEKQFALDMLALLLKEEKASPKEILSTLLTALNETVPYSDNFVINEHVLAIVELNLILDIRVYNGADSSDFYDVIQYIKSRPYDKKGTAKILPKAVYYYSIKKRNEAMSDVDFKSLLFLCNEAIEVLRDTESLYYMWELLCEREKLYEMAANYHFKVSYKQIKENTEWRKAIEIIYSIADVDKSSFEHTALYYTKGVACINDILRKRRKMLEISMESLCEGICSVRSLQRIEAGKTTPQKYVAENLLKKLKFPGVSRSCEMIIDNNEAKECLEKYKKTLNKGQHDKAFSILEKLQTLVTDERIQNKQFFSANKTYLLFRLGKMDKDRFCATMKQILALTVPFEKIRFTKEMCFSLQEINYIYNLLSGYDENTKEKSDIIRFLEKTFTPYINTELQAVICGHFEYIMASVQSYLGNTGEYERSNMYSDYTMLESLRNRRAFTLASCLYNRWWNDNESGELPVDNRYLVLYKTLSVIYKDKKSEAFIDKKINQLPFVPRLFSSSESSISE